MIYAVTMTCPFQDADAEICPLLYPDRLEAPRALFSAQATGALVIPTTDDEG